MWPPAIPESQMTWAALEKLPEACRLRTHLLIRASGVLMIIKALPLSEELMGALIMLLQTFWHSSAHVLGEALESCFGAKLTIGPALEEGFYYDCYLGDRTLTEADRPVLERRIEEVHLRSCVCPALPCADTLPFTCCYACMILML